MQKRTGEVKHFRGSQALLWVPWITYSQQARSLSWEVSGSVAIRPRAEAVEMRDRHSTSLNQCPTSPRLHHTLASTPERLFMPSHMTIVSQNGASNPSVRTPQLVRVETSPDRNADSARLRSCVIMRQKEASAQRAVVAERVGGCRRQ